MSENAKNKVSTKHNLDADQTRISDLIKDRIRRAREIITDTIISVQLYRKYNIFSNSEVNICIASLSDLHNKTSETFSKIDTEPVDATIDSLQAIIDKLSAIMSTFGTKSVDDLIYMTFGSGFLEYSGSPETTAKFELIRKYVHPIGFKVMTSAKPHSKTLCVDKMTDDILRLESLPQFECLNCEHNVSAFHNKVYGIKVIFRCEFTQKIMIMTGITDDVKLDLLENAYIDSRKRSILSESNACNVDILMRQIETMSLKDILIYGDNDIIKRNFAITSLSTATRTDKLEKTITKFASMDVFDQRNTLIDLLTCTDDSDLKYITYLLYDVITSSVNSDSNEQMMIYDSFPWMVKKYFKDAMKYTMNYTQQITHKYDVSQMSLEQQVYAMRVSDTIKDKAISKLKEIKNKPDDSNGKARQYLEGLLKIPFDVYREEPILRSTKLINLDFIKLIEIMRPILEITMKSYYTNMEIYRYLDKIEDAIKDHLHNIDAVIDGATRSNVGEIIKYIDNKSIKWYKLTTKNAQLSEIKKFVKNGSVTNKIDVLLIIKQGQFNIRQANCEIDKIRIKLTDFDKSLKEIDNAFDASIHGQTHAKNQLKKIICQWITGEQKGHCFGFEGSPGIGKTSLGKYGLSQCLKNDDGTPRPFAFITLGGSCNGSMLEGHGYTYLNATWGAIASAVMDAGCMNPIIFFDEADKTSKEHGSEINGLLTHLTDTTQNDMITDRFFPGVPLNLSKALFIFSYNDPDSIDKVLLDRIHRIKFENLTISEKIVIARDYIIPDISKSMGLVDTVLISDETIETIIISFTMEPGVRKLKEIIFDLYGELNIELLKKSETIITVPIVMTMDMVYKYLNKYRAITEQSIHTLPMVGVVNGLYANKMGRGGIIQIEASFFPSTTFLELKLTGLLGEVMKESMNVAKTLAWSLCSAEVRDKLTKEFELTKNHGTHIHCPEGSVGKEGPSAGVASTCAFFSLLNGKLIDNTVAITGEVDLRGNVTAIGGLEYKISGGIRAGVKTFLYPKENHKDFKEYQEKYGINEGITFIELSNVQDAFDHVFI